MTLRLKTKSNSQVEKDDMGLCENWVLHSNVKDYCWLVLGSKKYSVDFISRKDFRKCIHITWSLWIHFVGLFVLFIMKNKVYSSICVDCLLIFLTNILFIWVIVFSSTWYIFPSFCLSSKLSKGSFVSKAFLKLSYAYFFFQLCLFYMLSLVVLLLR